MPYPQYPVYSSPVTVSGMNVYGGLNTRGRTVYNSAYDPYHDASRFNGTAQRVDRTIVDPWGNITGYERGYEWRNSVTGQVHRDVRTYTPNGVGGTHVKAHASFAPR